VGRLGCGHEGHEEAVNGCSVLQVAGSRSGTEDALDPGDNVPDYKLPDDTRTKKNPAERRFARSG
jgi:hypothetical protein